MWATLTVLLGALDCAMFIEHYVYVIYNVSKSGDRFFTLTNHLRGEFGCNSKKGILRNSSQLCY